MILRPLAPAVAAGIANDQLTFEWNEWSVRDYYTPGALALEERLADVSGRGCIALTLAAGEWICQRFATLNADPAPMQYLEAGWGEQMKSGICRYTETVDDEWRGLVRGPLSIAITIANDALFVLEEDNDVAARVIWMTNLARHVLPSQDAFETWLAEVLDRLVQHHPKADAAAESVEGDEFELGRPVPRELFDTTRPYNRATEATLIASFLNSIDPQNPYLLANSP